MTGPPYSVYDALIRSELVAVCFLLALPLAPLLLFFMASPVAADGITSFCGPGASGVIRAAGLVACIKRAEGGKLSLSPSVSDAPSAQCDASGWCNVASSVSGNTFSVKVLSANGNIRTAYVNNSDRPWMFDCTGDGGKRVIIPGSSSYTAVIPGSVGESAHNYVCSR
jgi:hypothetical protein